MSEEHAAEHEPNPDELTAKAAPGAPFSKGVSPNPRGRPPSRLPRVRAVLEQLVLDESVAVTDRIQAASALAACIIAGRPRGA